MAEGTLATRSAASLADAWLPRRVRATALKPYLLLLPSLAFLALFTYFPILDVAWTSLFHAAYGQAQSFVGLENYARVLAYGAFRNALLNNLIYAVGTIVPSL